MATQPLQTLAPGDTSIPRIVIILRQLIQYVQGLTVPGLLGTQSANNVFAGPTSGGAATPAFRPMVAADLPAGTTPIAATKAQQQTGTDNVDFVSPLHQQDHDSGAKAWVAFDNTGSILASYNVTSVTKNGTGDFTVNFTTAFASGNYAAHVTGRGSASKNGWGQISHATAPTVSALRVQFVTDDTGSPAVFDPDSGHVVCFGRQ